MRLTVMEGKPERSDEAHLLALCWTNSVDWSLIARQAQVPDGLAKLLDGMVLERNAPVADKRRLHSALQRGLPIADISSRLNEWTRGGLSLTTVLDDDYPLNLRSIHNLPPFLFYVGQLREDDAYSVAVVGTRTPSPSGLRRASRIAGLLATKNVIVLSGLARGIDTAAHRSALQAGGRTIAVLGSGLLRVYPPENSSLAGEIARSGAVVSQFWPDSPPASYNFPRRNIVTSGLGQGTVVIEATATSGAKMQARLALEHGKKVFLLKSLVDSHAWAKRYVQRGAIPVEDVRDVQRHLVSVDAIREASDKRHQLAMQLVG